MSEDILSTEQKKSILQFWQDGIDAGKPPNIMDITTRLFGADVDGRSKEGKAVKDYLASLNIKPRTSEVYEKKRVELTLDHQEFVKNNRDSMSSVEMAKVLFNNTQLTNLSKEARSIDEFNRSLGEYSYKGQEDVPLDDWRPPNTVERTIARVNRQFERGGGIDKDKISPMQKKQMEALMRYLSVYRFKSQINVYEDDADRELFESVFIRYTYDKGDLLEEEIDQYIILAKEAVLEKRIQRRSEMLQGMLETQAEGDPEKAKLSMTLVEMIGKITTEYNACIVRQRDLVNVLKEKRSDRLSKDIKENSSILNLLEIWKSAKTRKEFALLAEKRKEKVADEIERLSSMEDVLCRVIGLPKDEALNG